MDNIIMPKQGLQMTEGTIIKWLISEGEQVTDGQPLLEIETDKVTTQIEAPVSGTLLKIISGEGETVPVAQTIAYVGQPGENIEETATADTKEEEDNKQQVCSFGQTEKVTAVKTDKLASPRAKKTAVENRVDLNSISGSGPDGVIVEADVKKAMTPLARKVADVKGVDIFSVQGSGVRGKIVADDVRGASSGERIVPMSPMRKIIASRMCESLTSMAQAFHNISLDASGMIALREQFKKADIKISYNDIIVRAACKVLQEFPDMNASVAGENIIYKSDVSIGLAVSVEKGLLVPVIRNVQRLSLEEIATESKTLIKKAQEGALTGDALTGGTFTISNLGMHDIDSFRAIVNPPQVGILAVGKIDKKPVVVSDEICIRPIMQICLTYDHRIVDGAPAAKFLMRLKQLLQYPALML